jgi:hypothetical protein
MLASTYPSTSRKFQIFGKCWGDFI